MSFRDQCEFDKSVKNNLTLEDGVTYYASVFAVDSVGNESFASSSIIIDQSPPVIGSVIDGSETDSEWST